MKILLTLVAILLTSFIVVCYSIWMPHELKSEGWHLIDHYEDTEIEACLVQRSNGEFLNPYEVSVLIKKKGMGKWNRYYVTHESYYWHSGNLKKENSNDVLKIVKNKTNLGKYKLNENKYYHHFNWLKVYEPIDEVEFNR